MHMYRGIFFFIFFIHQAVYAGKDPKDMKFHQLANHLYQAARAKDVTHMKELLEAGAPSHIVFTLLITDKNKKNVDVINSFLDVVYACDLINSFKRGQLTLLMHAVIHDRADLLIELLARSANFDMQDSNGWTALHWACAHCFYECAKTLCFLGANKQILDLKDRTPLDVLYEKNSGHLLTDAQRANLSKIEALLR